MISCNFSTSPPHPLTPPPHMHPQRTAARVGLAHGVSMFKPPLLKQPSLGSNCRQLYLDVQRNQPFPPTNRPTSQPVSHSALPLKALHNEVFECRHAPQRVKLLGDVGQGALLPRHTNLEACEGNPPAARKQYIGWGLLIRGVPKRSQF